VTPVQITAREEPGADWDAFLARHGGAPLYLRSGWCRLARDVFRHRVFFLEARDGEVLRGVLPLVQQRGVLGNFATSVPFFSYGGAHAETDDTAVSLMAHARDLARDLGCSYLELRDSRQYGGDFSVRTDKVSMVLQLPDTAAALSKQLGSKLRSQIKRADRENPVVRRGGVDLLDGFYDVFARNMRDLGTPVYPARFFREILERFPHETELIVIECKGRPAAGGFLVHDGPTTEIPWACCRSDAKPLGINMKLYWEVLSASLARGSRNFDFGRSTVDSGPYQFKRQWGAQPRQLYWHRWERRPRPQPDNAGESRLRRYAVAVWQRLPLGMANLLGTRISPGLPW
jgi:FemAB-related protein (PEP-CTERM system-associated)